MRRSARAADHEVQQVPPQPSVRNEELGAHGGSGTLRCGGSGPLRSALLRTGASRDAAALAQRPVRRPLADLFQPAPHLTMIDQACLLVDDATGFEHHEVGDSADSKLARELRMRLCVDFEHHRASCPCGGHFLHMRSGRFTRSAPLRPKVHQDGHVDRLDHFPKFVRIHLPRNRQRSNRGATLSAPSRMGHVLGRDSVLLTATFTLTNHLPHPLRMVVHEDATK